MSNELAPYPHFSARIIGRIIGLPTYDFTEENKMADLPHDPAFNDIRQATREHALNTVIKSLDTPGYREHLTEEPEALRARAKLAYTSSFSRYSMPKEDYQRLGDILGLKKPFGRLQRQSPGTMATMHMDDLNIGYMRSYESMNDDITFSEEELRLFDSNNAHAIRFLIFLQPSLPGQLVYVGKQVISQWDAGEILAFDWLTTPHATANAGFWDRDLIRITGLCTEKTIAMLDKWNTELF